MERMQLPRSEAGSEQIFHRLAGGNRLTLTTCRRSGSFLFDFYGSLIHGGCRFHLPLNDVLNEARNLFNYESICENNLVIFHAKRKRINREMPPLAVKPEGAMHMRAVAAKGQQYSTKHVALAGDQPSWLHEWCQEKHVF